MLSWLFGNKRTSNKKTPVATIDNGGGAFAIDVVGESHYQNELSKICGGKTEDGHEHQCMAHLILEDDNRHDAHAVRVDIGGNTVGYLSRKNARKFRRELAAAVPGVNVWVAQCPAMIVGGWSRDRERDQGHLVLSSTYPRHSRAFAMETRPLNYSGIIVLLPRILDDPPVHTFCGGLAAK